MPFTRIWIHCVWATRKREKILNREICSQLFGYMVQQARNHDIFIDRINGSNDHIHLLVSLSADQNIAKVMQSQKGSSAFWMNRRGLLPFRFGWQDDYFAVSVSESQIEKVRNYIDEQVEHHRVKSFDDEYREFIEKFGFSMQEDGSIVEV